MAKNFKDFLKNEAQAEKEFKQKLQRFASGSILVWDFQEHWFFRVEDKKTADLLDSVIHKKHKEDEYYFVYGVDRILELLLELEDVNATGIINSPMFKRVLAKVSALTHKKPITFDIVNELSNVGRDDFDRAMNGLLFRYGVEL